MDQNIEIKRLRTNSPFYIEAEALLRSAFVADERRADAEQRLLADNGSLFSMNAVVSDGEFAGVVGAWNFGKLLYLEHLAIEPSRRGKGVGSAVLNLLSEKSHLPMLVEVEPAGSTDEADRRIAFYEHAGFKAWQAEYVQPAYGPGKNTVPMVLMGRDFEETDENVKVTVALLRKQVYGQI